MTFNEYKDYIVDKLEYQFDIKGDTSFCDTDYDVYAVCDVNNIKYMGVKSAKVYEYKNSEHVYIKHFESFQKESFDSIISKTKEKYYEGLEVDANHMCTFYTLVFVTDNSVEKSLKKEVKRFVKTKDFALSFKGYAGLRIVLVQLDSDEVVVSKRCNKKILQSYKPLNNNN